MTTIAFKSLPVEAKIQDIEINNEPTLKVLSERNCYLRDGTDRWYVFQICKDVKCKC